MNATAITKPSIERAPLVACFRQVHGRPSDTDVFVSGRTIG
jgi:hypothetical protein